ncbi:MAG: hypothetical protein RLZZ227_337 [Pseudomonadota bacterium]|jgi:hypothetical protein
MKPTLKGALLLVPMLVLGGMSLLHEYKRNTGTAWTVPILGYDPRDLLSGHYLQFQYAWNFAPGAAAGTCSGEECALCTQQAGVLNPEVSLVPLADAPAACASFIAGSVPGADLFFISGATDNLQRYYIPESEADRLQQLLMPNTTDTGLEELPQFSLGLRVTSAGRAYIEAMYVDGVPLEDWLAR